jgi:MFS family permease
MAETDSLSAGATGASVRRLPVAWMPTVAFMFVGDLLLWADRSNFSVAASAWNRQYGWTLGVTGAMLSAFSFGYFIAMPFGGFIVDRVGPRRVLAAAGAGFSLFCLLTPIAPATLWLTGAFRTLLGVAEAPFLPAVTAAIARAIPRRERRGVYNAFIQSGSGLGPAIGTIFAGLIAGTLGVPWIFVIFGGVGIALALAWTLYAWPRGEPAPSAAEAGQPETRERAAEPPMPLRMMLSSRVIWVFVLTYFAVPYSNFLILTWLPLYLTRFRGVHLVLAGVLSAIPFLAAFVAANLAGLLSDLFAGRGWTWDGFHRKVFIAIGGGLYVVTILIGALSSSATVAVVMIVLATVGIQVTATPYWIIATDIAPHQSGTLSGVMNFFGILGATIAPAASGFMAQATHAFVLPFQVSAGIMLVAVVALLALVRVRPLSKLV